MIICRRLWGRHFFVALVLPDGLWRRLRVQAVRFNTRFAVATHWMELAVIDHSHYREYYLMR